MIKAAVLDAMVAAGCTAEQIAAVVKADQASSSGAARQARYRARKASPSDGSDVTTVTVTASDALPSPEGSSPTPPSPNPLPTNPPSPPKGGSSPIDQAIEVFSEQAARAGLAVPRKVTADRRRKVAARLSESGPELWAEACRKMADSSFCRGINDRGWRADLDFLCQPKSFNGLIEGKYDDRQRFATAPPGRRMNAVEAGLSLHEQDHDQQSRTVDHRDDEWVPANVTRLPGPVEDAARSFAQRFGRGGH